MLCNTDGKYTKQVFDYGADVSISNFNYGFNFWFNFSISHFIYFFIRPGTYNIKGAAVGRRTFVSSIKALSLPHA
jgi:hypothetical protein